MTPKDYSEAPVSSHKRLSLLSGPNINDELGESTADKGSEITESDKRNGSTTQSPTPRSEQPINVH